MIEKWIADLEERRSFLQTEIAKVDHYRDELVKVEAGLIALRGEQPRAKASTPRTAKTQRSNATRRRRGRTPGEVTPQREQVLAYLREHPDSTAVQISEALGIRASNIYNQMTRMASVGLVTMEKQDGRKTYSVPAPASEPEPETPAAEAVSEPIENAEAELATA